MKRERFDSEEILTVWQELSALIERLRELDPWDARNADIAAQLRILTNGKRSKEFLGCLRWIAGRAIVRSCHA